MSEEKWNVTSLKEYFEMQFNLFENNINNRFANSEEAVNKAEHEMNRRLNGMNEFREQLKDQENTYITRTEYNLHHQSMLDKVTSNTKLIYWGIGIWAVVQIIIGIIVAYELNKL